MPCGQQKTTPGKALERVFLGSRGVEEPGMLLKRCIREHRDLYTPLVGGMIRGGMGS
jgi:hypothetical protein